MSFCDYYDYFVDWLDKWQTLIAGILALGAGVIIVAGTLRAANRQVTAANGVERERIARETYAFFAVSAKRMNKRQHATVRALSRGSSHMRQRHQRGSWSDPTRPSACAAPSPFCVARFVVYSRLGS